MSQDIGIVTIKRTFDFDKKPNDATKQLSKTILENMLKSIDVHPVDATYMVKDEEVDGKWYLHIVAILDVTKEDYIKLSMIQPEGTA